MIERAAVIGTTAWGTTLALLLARNGVPTTLVARTPEEARALEADRENARRLPGFPFPETLHAAAEADALSSADLVCFAVPSESMADNARRYAPAIASGVTLLSASKGIELSTGRRMSEVLRALVPGRPVAVLSGPNLSHEVASGLPGTTVIASADADLASLRAAFHAHTFRVYTSADIVGVELGGTLKNIVAIAGGVVDAFRYGNNAKAAVITRGIAEITRLGIATGASPMTFQGLAGVGDAVASSYSPLSRNRRFGELVGGGLSTKQALEAIGETVEGVRTVPAALQLARGLSVELPLTAALDGVIAGTCTAAQAIEELLERSPTDELHA
jgi:glycerol-3-phosphate dehydrogenase (NAD(P)+)